MCHQACGLLRDGAGLESDTGCKPLLVFRMTTYRLDHSGLAGADVHGRSEPRPRASVGYQELTSRGVGPRG